MSKSKFDSWYDKYYQNNLRHYSAYSKCKKAWEAGEKQAQQENEQLRTENEQLRAHVERLRRIGLTITSRRNYKTEDYLALTWDLDVLVELLDETPAQSLQAIERRGAEKMREACMNGCESAREEVEQIIVDRDWRSPAMEVSTLSEMHSRQHIRTINIDEVINNGRE